MIAVERVIPALRESECGQVLAIASRGLDKARAVAQRHGIPRAYGSYDELLADPDVEAVYNPLPNHLHLEWSRKALQAGKHVLCEKPIAMNAAEAEQLIGVRDRTGLKIEEAFMVRNHPQWLRVRELIEAGRIGELRAVQIAFTYQNTDPDDIRNNPATGGGAIYDLGCYACTLARFVFDDEPRRVAALVDRDANFGIDRLSSAILDFPAGQATLFVSTQTARYQGAVVLGSEGWIRFQIPFVPIASFDCRLYLGGNELPGPVPQETIDIEPVDQYVLQSDRFSRLVRGEAVAEWPLENAAANMRVLDALFRSADSRRWEAVV